MRNSSTIFQEFQAYKDGYYINGRNSDGTCIEKTSSNSNQFINSNFDHPLKFKQENLYSCYKNLTFNEFNNFCINKRWKYLELFNVENEVIFLGKYGSSEINYKSVSIILFLFV